MCVVVRSESTTYTLAFRKKPIAYLTPVLLDVDVDDSRVVLVLLLPEFRTHNI